MNIAVYCSARDGIDPLHRQDATDLGLWIGRGGHTLVYGGIALGLMEIVARQAHIAGGRLTGVVPQLRSSLANPLNDETIMVADLYERKREMERRADAFVALAGGYGTLDELVSTWTSLSFNGTPRPVIALSRNGLYEPLRTLADRMVADRLMSPDVRANISFAPDVNTVIDILADYNKQITL